ncbi:hypothetical protein C0995_004458, partial [Termitomyces sp. Mi166
LRSGGVQTQRGISNDVHEYEAFPNPYEVHQPQPHPQAQTRQGGSEADEAYTGYVDEHDARRGYVQERAGDEAGSYYEVEEKPRVLKIANE